MFDILQALIFGPSNALVLRSYGWRPRKLSRAGSSSVQWQDPSSSHWYSESTAMRLVKVQALDQLKLR